MTKAEWLGNNRKYIPGLDENWDEEYMSSLFDRIAGEPFQLQGAATNNAKQNISDPLKRQMAFVQETQEMVKDSQAAIRNTTSEKAEYFSAKSVELLQPMFAASAFPVLAPLSMLLDQSADPRVISMCLRCFEHCICIACLFAMETERSTFVTTLTKFTHMRKAEMLQPKQIACVRALIGIARDNANFLQSAWAPVLRVVSQLEKIQCLEGMDVLFERRPQSPLNVKKPLKSSESFTPIANESVAPSVTSAPNSPAPVDDDNNEELVVPPMSPSTSSPKPRRSLSSLQQEISLPTRIDLDAIDRLFTRSIHLTGAAILDFVTGLTQVSTEELNESTPRFFSLVKLVVVGHYNMNRIRWVWSRVWRVLANHFEKAGCHAKEQVAMHAIDSLRNLSMAFLEKDELANFSFQKEFLRPFERIMLERPLPAVRELVIRCVSQMIDARANNIKSGWKSIFAVFRAAASDPEEKIVALAFAKVGTIMRRFFPLIAESFFVECVSCLAAYGNNNLFKEMGLKAIASLEYCATQLADGKVCALGADALKEAEEANDSSSVSTSESKAVELNAKGEPYLFMDTDKHMSLWFPILTGLAAIIAHPHIDVRTAALEALFDLLRTHGPNFSPGLWRVVFPGVLMPIFDSVRYAGGVSSPEDEEWLNTTCYNALRSLVELVQSFCEQAPFLLGELLKLLAGCILQGNESLAEIGTTSLLHFVLSSAQTLTPGQWDEVIAQIEAIANQNGAALEKVLAFELRLPLTKAEKEAQEKEKAKESEAPSTDASKENVDDNNEGEKENEADKNVVSATQSTESTNTTQDSETSLEVVDENDLEAEEKEEKENSDSKQVEDNVTVSKIRKETGYDDDKCDGTIKSTLTVQLRLVESLDTIVTTQLSFMGQQRATTLLSVLLRVRQHAGNLRMRVERAKQGMSVAQALASGYIEDPKLAKGDLERMRRPRRDSIHDAISSSSKRPNTALVRLEARAAVAAYECSQATRKEVLQAGKSSVRCERLMLLRCVRDAAEGFGASPTSELGEVLAQQLRWLRDEFPDEFARKHLASLHGIGAAAAAGDVSGETVQNALSLMQRVLSLAGVVDEPLTETD